MDLVSGGGAPRIGGDGGQANPMSESQALNSLGVRDSDGAHSKAK